ncbi:uncharacterized protein LOC111712455 isoform X2 [Eurytemora carolleeae]|nr:uncharacterized protein LOC111712455 isoform X2 [Eurytemora carolleeae]|eukprot:XP_023342833.1 uncharacterized protein LOC111712455 isoform X2 [Eurytemora affinis]
MHLSECFTGGGPPASHIRSSSTHQPSIHRNQSQSTYRSVDLGISTPDPSSVCGDDSVFLPNSPQGLRPSLQSEDISDQIATLKVGRPPPSRPPKPSGLRNPPLSSQVAGENYENLGTAQHILQLAANQRENNNNNPDPLKNISLPPAPVPPPKIDRRLKPFNRPGSGDSATLPAGGMMSRKPSQFDTLPCMETGYGMHIPSAPGSKYGNIERSPSIESLSIQSRRNSEEETIYYYMPSLQHSNNDGMWDPSHPIMIPAQDMHGHSVEYLDLDLPRGNQEPSDDAKQTKHEDSSTVYKTVDFVKTEAFNRTKKNVEQKRYNIHQ